MSMSIYTKMKAIAEPMMWKKETTFLCIMLTLATGTWYLFCYIGYSMINTSKFVHPLMISFVTNTIFFYNLMRGLPIIS